MQAEKEEPSSPHCLLLLAQQHGKYGDELQSLGAYRAARSHYLEALQISQRIESDIDSGIINEEISDDITSLRFHQSLLDNDERFRFERLNLIALIAFDRGRYLASIELLDTLLAANLDPDTQQSFQSKRARAVKLAEEQGEALEVTKTGSDPLLTIAKRAEEQRHDILSIAILGYLKAINDDMGLNGRRLSSLMNSDQQTAVQRFINQVDDLLRDLLTRINETSKELHPFLKKLLDKAELQVEDLNIMLARQGPETDREALLRPSVVIDGTIAEKVVIGKQVLLMMNLIQPYVKSVEDRLQELNQLDNLRLSINDRRRNSTGQLISDRLSKFVQALKKCDNAHVFGTVQQLLSSLVSSYSNVSTSALMNGMGTLDTDLIVNRFRTERDQTAIKLKVLQPRLSPVIKQARANVLSAFQSKSISFDQREELIKKAHGLFAKVVTQCSTRELMPQQHDAKLGMLQCNQALEVLRCRKEAKYCSKENNKERALKWMIRASCYWHLDQMEGEVIDAASGYISQIRARANLVAGIDLLETHSSVDNPDRAVENLISRFMMQAQALDPNDTTILNWAKAFRLRSEGIALLSKKEYHRAKAVFEECIELVDSQIFRLAEHVADEMLYKHDLRNAVERLQIRRSYKNSQVNVMSYKTADVRNKFVNSLLDELLNGVDDREDYEEAISTVFQNHAIFEDDDIKEDELNEFRASCIAKLKTVLGRHIADVEGALHVHTAEWLTNRSIRLKSREEQHRQLLLRLVARTLVEAHNELKAELTVDCRMFGRILSALLNCSLQESMTPFNFIQAGEYMGRELASVWRPDNAKTDDDKIASNVVNRWILQSKSAQTGTS